QKFRYSSKTYGGTTKVMGQIWGMSRCFLHACPDVLKLERGLVVHPFGVHLDQHCEVLVPHLLGDERKVTTRYQAPAGVGVARLVGAAWADLGATLDVGPLRVPRRRNEPRVYVLLACLHNGR